MIFSVYCIFNIIDGRIYIGKTNNINKRWLKHKTQSPNKFLRSAINKYGLKNFEFSILQSFNDESNCLNSEKYWISFYKSNTSKYPNELGYNFTDGGEGVSGFKRNEKSKIQQSITFKSRGHKGPWFGKKLPECIKSKLSKHNLGKIMSTESKILIRQSKLGSKNPHSKLNEQKVIEIKNLLNKGISRKEIGILFNVNYETIANIDRGERWAHIKI